MSKTKKQDLGVFYTPPVVVQFIINILNTIKEKEDIQYNRWSLHKPKAHFPTVIDPACGEGIFLKQAVQNELTGSDWVFGLDIDEEAVNKWPTINLLKEFKGNIDILHAHFFHQNGLNKLDLTQHKKYYKEKILYSYLGKEQFDCVVGNPPYGGIGIADFSLDINTGLEESLNDFQTWRIRNKTNKISEEVALFGDSQLANKGNLKKLLERFPIEVLFLERFLRLAKPPKQNKPGGKIAIILPEGIFTNSSMHYVRDFIIDNTRVIGIVSLPRNTFKDVGTTAKTCILFLRKEKSTSIDYPVFIASTDKLSEINFNKIHQYFKEFYDN